MADGMTQEASQPRYALIRAEISRRIAQGDYPAGTAMPSENELAEEFGTTRLTVRNALSELVKEGLVRRMQGKGAYVASAWISGGELDTDGFRETVRSANAVPGVRILSRSTRRAGEYFANLFSIDPDDLLYSVRRLNSVDGIPVSIERALIPLYLFKGIEQIDLSVFSLYETYEMYGHKTALAQERLGIEALSARDARLLGVPAESEALVLECLSYDAEGVVIEYARALNRGDLGGYFYRY